MVSKRETWLNLNRLILRNASMSEPQDALLSLSSAAMSALVINYHPNGTLQKCSRSVVLFEVALFM